MAKPSISNQETGSTLNVRDMAPKAAHQTGHGPAMFRNFNLALPPAEKQTVSPDRKQALGLGKSAPYVSDSRLEDEPQKMDEPQNANPNENLLSSVSTNVGDSMHQTGLQSEFHQTQQSSFTDGFRPAPEEPQPISNGPMLEPQLQQDIFGPRLIDTPLGTRSKVRQSQSSVVEDLLGRHLHDAAENLAQQSFAFDTADQDMMGPWYGSESRSDRSAAVSSSTNVAKKRSSSNELERRESGIPMPRSLMMTEKLASGKKLKDQNASSSAEVQLPVKISEEPDIPQRVKSHRHTLGSPLDARKLQETSPASKPFAQIGPKETVLTVKQPLVLLDTSTCSPLASPRTPSPKSPIIQSPRATQLIRSTSRIFKVTKQALYDFWDMDVQAQKSCRSLPFTIAFWLIFVITQLSHRQVSLAYEIQSFTSTLLESQVEIIAESQVQTSTSSNASSSRRLATASSSGSSGSGSGGVAGGSSGTARAGEVNSDGLTLSAVTSVRGIYDWIDRSLVRLAWNSRTEPGLSYISSFNRVIGGTRLQQTRLSTDTCPGNKDFREYFNARCYSRSRKLNGTSMNPLLEGFSTGSGEVFTYWLDIYQDMDDTLGHTKFLQDQAWIDTATDQVTAQLALYNEQVALFAFAETTFKIDLSGKLDPHTKVKVLPTQVYSSPGMLVGDTIMMAMLGWLAIGEIFKICNEPLKTYITPFAILNWTLVLQGCGLVGFFAWLTTSLDALEDDIYAVVAPPANTNYLPGSHVWEDRHQKLNVLYDHMRTLVGFMNAAEFATFAYTMVMVFKFFEAFHGNPRLALLSQTFFECIVDVAHFLVVFVTIFLNFSLGGYFMFGSQLEEWSNLMLAFMTTFRAMMGDFEFSSMYKVAPVSATVWFISFMVLVFLVMLNMLLAIIMDVYDSVKNRSKMHMSLANQTLFVLQKLKMLTQGWFTKSSMTQNFKKLEEIIKDESLDVNREPITVEFLTSRGLDEEFAKNILKRVPETTMGKSKEADKEEDEEAKVSREVVVACQKLLERVVKLQALESKQCASNLRASLSGSIPIGPSSLGSSPLLPDAVPEPSVAHFELPPRETHLPGSVAAPHEESDA